MVDADQRAQECIPAHHFGVQRLFSRGIAGWWKRARGI